MTKTQLYRTVGDALMDHTDALDDEEIQAVSKAVANKVVEEFPDLFDDEPDDFQADDEVEE